MASLFAVTPETKLRRILVLGVDGNSYAAKMDALSGDAMRTVQAMLDSGHGQMVVKMVVEMGASGRCAKMDALMFTLAACMYSKDVQVRRDAYDAMLQVCGTPNHLFSLFEHLKRLAVMSVEERSSSSGVVGGVKKKEKQRGGGGTEEEEDDDVVMVTESRKDRKRKKKQAAKELAAGASSSTAAVAASIPQQFDITSGKGWGRLRKSAVARWYSRAAGLVAFQITKYPNRNGWAHGDALRMCHMKPTTVAHDIIAAYAVSGINEARTKFASAMPGGIEMAASLRNKAVAARSGKGKRARKEEAAAAAAASVGGGGDGDAEVDAAADEFSDVVIISNVEQGRRLRACAQQYAPAEVVPAPPPVAAAPAADDGTEVFSMADLCVQVARWLRSSSGTGSVIAGVAAAGAAGAAECDEDGGGGSSEDVTEEGDPDRAQARECIRVMTFLEAVVALREAKVEGEAVNLVREFHLAREHVPTNLLGSVAVWMALLQRMPPLAMIRNLGKMSSIHALDADSEGERLVVARLRNEEAMRRARVHPIQILLALRQYQMGHGDKGSLTWMPNVAVAAALDHAFGASFRGVESTGSRLLLGLDVSGSMDGARIPGTAITAREGSVAMVLVALRSEPNVQVVSFQNKLVPLRLDREISLDAAMRSVRGLPFGSTDCSAPMEYAIQHKLKVDCFIIYTDSETNSGGSPAEALRRYRTVMKMPDAKLIVVGMTSTRITIADPNDPGMLDVVGFDANAPLLIGDFIAGRL